MSDQSNGTPKVRRARLTDDERIARASAEIERVKAKRLANLLERESAAYAALTELVDAALSLHETALADRARKAAHALAEKNGNGAGQ